jgi:hypothetical protein
MKKRYSFLLIILMFFISACAGQKPEAPPVPTATAAEKTTEPPHTKEADQTEETDTPASDALPPEPQVVSFSAEDGVLLEGLFYPAVKISAPVIVLMHWYPGDQHEWTEIAYWLQNRGITGIQDGVPWKDPSWFPALSPDLSFNIFTFTFRNCQRQCSSPEPAGWLMDARASLEYARTLEGVDPNRVIAIGASIGSDGAIDGCASVLEVDPTACLGALSLSPGSYLGPDYNDMVTALGENTPPRIAWCLFDENEADSVDCNQALGDNYYHESWSDGYLHGMHLLTPNLDPLPLARIVKFLDLVLEN